MYGPRNGTPESCAVVIRLEPEQYLAIADCARQDDRSMSSWVRRAVERQLKNGGRAA